MTKIKKKDFKTPLLLAVFFVVVALGWVLVAFLLR